MRFLSKSGNQASFENLSEPNQEAINLVDQRVKSFLVEIAHYITTSPVLESEIITGSGGYSAVATWVIRLSPESQFDWAKWQATGRASASSVMVVELGNLATDLPLQVASWIQENEEKIPCNGQQIAVSNDLENWLTPAIAANATYMIRRIQEFDSLLINFKP